MRSKVHGFQRLAADREQWNLLAVSTEILRGAEKIVTTSGSVQAPNAQTTRPRE